MRGIIALIRGEDSEPDYIDHIPVPARSMVGGVVMSLGNALASYRNSAAALQADIAAKSEQLRQTLAAIGSMEAALLNLADDPALTDDERTVASEQIVDAMMKELE